MKTQIIQLESHDDLITTRDKMSWSKAPRILLVWPRKGKLLEREVDLLLLQRYAQSLGAQLGIVTTSLHIQNQAAEIGIPHFRSAVQAQRQVWRRGRGRKRVNLRLLERKPASQDLRKRFKEVTIGRTWSPESLGLRIGSFGLGVIAVLALALVFWPSAIIRLLPESRSQQLAFELRASTKIAAANLSGGIPAEAVQVVVEGSDQERSSGFAMIPDTQARGLVEFSNLGESALTIPAGSVVATVDDSRQRFETLAAVEIPAGVGSKAGVQVRAFTPGMNGNVSAGSIRALEGPLGLLVTVNNPADLEGGQDRKSIGPSSQDYGALRERLVASLEQTARSDLMQILGDERRLIDGTIQIKMIEEETQSPLPGEPGDFARLTMRIEFIAWAVREDDLQSVARSAMDANIESGYQAAPGNIDIVFLGPGTVDGDGGVRWKISAGRRLEAVIDREEVGRLVTGLTVEESGRLLSRHYLLASPPEIQVQPRWWPRLPFLSFRIEVVTR